MSSDGIRAQWTAAILAEIARLQAIESVAGEIMLGWNECSEGCPRCGVVDGEHEADHVCGRPMADLKSRSYELPGPPSPPDASEIEREDTACPECGRPWDAPDPDYSDCAQHECHAKTDEKVAEHDLSQGCVGCPCSDDGGVRYDPWCVFDGIGDDPDAFWGKPAPATCPLRRGHVVIRATRKGGNDD